MLEGRPLVVPGLDHVRGGDVHRGPSGHLAPQSHPVGDIARRHMRGTASQRLGVHDEEMRQGHRHNLAVIGLDGPQLVTCALTSRIRAYVT